MNWLTTNIEWIKLVLSFLTGGLALRVYDSVVKKGTVTLNKYNVHLHYKSIRNEVHFIEYFTLDLEFKNKSGHQKTVENISCRLFDGKEFRNLKYAEYNINPSANLFPKSIIALTYKVITYHQNDAPILELAKQEAFFELSYTVERKVKITNIPGDKIQLTGKETFLDANYLK